MRRDRLLAQGGKKGHVMVARFLRLANGRTICGPSDRYSVEISFFGTACGAFAHSRFRAGRPSHAIPFSRRGSGPVRLPQARPLMPHCWRRLRGWR